MPKPPDIRYHRFGHLVVIKYTGKTKSGKHRWKCRCDCGNEISVTNANLLSGKVLSCDYCYYGRSLTVNNTAYKKINFNEPTTAVTNSRFYKPYLLHTKKSGNKFSEIRNGSMFEIDGEIYMKVYDTNCLGRYNAVSLSTDKYISIDNEQIISIL